MREKLRVASRSKTNLYLQKLQRVVGGTITDTIRGGDPKQWFEDELYGLEITTPDGKRCVLWLLKDDAGNGAGAFEIQEL